MKIGEEYSDISEQLAKVTMKKKNLEEKVVENQIYLRVAK